MRFELDLPPALACRGGRADLDEMLGNLLDNACTWARSRLSVAGVQEADRSAAPGRGRRA